MPIMTPSILSLRLSHLENVLSKANIEYVDSEHPAYMKINGLYNHIFRDLRGNKMFDVTTMENIEQLIDESHIFFLTNVKSGVFEKITEAKQLLYNKISPMSIVANRLAIDNSEVGILDDLPTLVKNKISEIIKNEML